MAIVPLPLPSTIESRALLHHLPEHGDIVGRDTTGRSIIQLKVDDWVLERLMAFDAESADLEDGGDYGLDADDEEDGPPVVADLVQARVIRWERRSQAAQTRGKRFVHPAFTRIPLGWSTGWQERRDRC